MGISSCEPVHARHCNGSRGADDRTKAQAALRRGCRRSGLCLILLCWAVAAQADALRIATYHLDYALKGPGLLLRDLQKGGGEKGAAIASVVAEVSPDVLFVQGLDWDYEGRTVAALAALLKEAGADYPHVFAGRPNTGMMTDHDLDGNGRIAERRDAQGYGAYPGQGGMAVLSRFPIGDVGDYSDLLWADVPGAELPVWDNGKPFPSVAAQAVQRLSTTAHWVVPLTIAPDKTLSVLTLHASPPVFDGPEDRNGLRNAAEIRLLEQLIDARLGPGVAPPWVIAGNLNLDPSDGDGRKDAVRRLLSRPDLTDPRPESAGAVAAAEGAHIGPPALDTVDWPQDGPGNLRVSYVLPHKSLAVSGSGVHWPAQGPKADVASAASRHRLVWVDVLIPD